MDDTRFDTLTRTLTAAGSRRRALVLILMGALAPLLAREDAAAHDPTKACRKKSGKAKKKCLKKAKAHNAQHAAAALPPGPTCSDGVKNGSESDVDCGGSCPRCVTGKTCTSRNDCTTAFCFGGKCQGCSQFSCEPGCNCLLPTGTCINAVAAESGKTSCGQCPAGTVCQGTATPNVFGCHRLCGASTA